MNSHDRTLQILASYYSAFNAGNSDAMLDLLANEVIHDLNEGPREIGKAVFAAFNQRMARCYREQLVDIVLMASADGRHAAAEFIVEGSYIATDEGLPTARGQSYRLPAGAFFELHDERITRVSMYYNLHGWLAQIANE